MSATESHTGSGTTKEKEPALSKAEAEAIVEEKEALLQKESEHKKRVHDAHRVLEEHRKMIRKQDPDISAADKTIRNHAIAAAAAAIVPVPGVDVVAVGGIQIKMLSSLAKIFHVPMSADGGKVAISALVGSAGSLGMGGMMAVPVYSMLKFIPIVGTLASFSALPSMVFGATYALGKVFTAHFASGGNLLNFDPVRSRAAFQSHFEEGKASAPSSPRPVKG